MLFLRLKKYTVPGMWHPQNSLEVKQSIYSSLLGAVFSKTFKVYVSKFLSKDKYQILAVLFFLFFAQSIYGQDNFGATAQLQLQVEDLKFSRGQVYIAVYNSSDGFREIRSACRLRVVEVNTTSVETTFNDLPSGEYAVTLFQDLNSNGKIDTNLMGIPTEPYGFSNNPKIYFGPPSFDATKVKLSRGETAQLQISLR